MSTSRVVRAPRGNQLSCKGWHQEAAMRMLMNNLDPDVAENPGKLIVYGGTGRAARSWEAFDAIVRSLRELENDETLLVQSGKPVGVFKTHDEAPRVLIANSNLVGQWSNYPEFNRLEKLGLTMYGQMTAGSWIYIGSQGIVQGTFETFAAAGEKHFGGSLEGKFVVTGGLGGMGGAQPLAATMNGALFLGVDVDGSRIEKRLKSGYCDKIATSLDEALQLIEQARKRKVAISVGLVGNCADVLPEMVKRDVVPDILTDQTSAHDALNGYVPHGMTLDEALALRAKNPDQYVERSMHSMGVHVEAMLALQRRGAITFDYGNNIRTQAKKAGVENAFDIPGFVPEYIRPLFCEGKGPFRWVALSGDPEDIARTDALALELFPRDEVLSRWMKLAKERIQFQGLPSRICWLGYGARAELGVAMNELVRRGEIKAPIVIGRDHLDTGSVASPFRETEAMLDGSDAIADWPLLNALVNTAGGASWVSIHNGGGVGIGYSQHAGMVVVADGTDNSKRRLERTLTSDPGMGVIRHVDSGYTRAIDFAKAHDIKIPMEPIPATPARSILRKRMTSAGCQSAWAKWASRQAAAKCRLAACAPQQSDNPLRGNRTHSRLTNQPMQKLIECVPNFSEGRDQNIIRQITAAIESADGVSLLDVDPGASTNRTVVTFVGTPTAAIEGAFRGIQKAAELIDMRKHKGAHPRMGATDVCPFVPVSNVTWEEAIACANELGKRVAESLKIPIYLYERAAKDPSRSNLSLIRAGEYEGFADKIKDPKWKPDFGQAVFNEKSGATVIGAREFLVAYNVNLNTKAVRRANSVAFDIREQGRIKTEDGTPTGKKVLDAKGEPMRMPGMLKHVKAIGWYVEEYGMAQVSINLTNIEETPLHAAFDACVESASGRGLRVTGSEIVGMVPKKSLLDAGRYFLRKQKWSEGASEEELIDVAVRSLGLSELKPFDPKEKIIEFKIEATASKKILVRQTVREFCNETLSDSPAPGGGSVAALMGALGASLGGMVANLSASKRGWDEKLEFFSGWAVKGQQLKDELLFLVDEDTAAFNKVMAAFALPKDSPEEKIARVGAINEANKYAAEIPLRVMEVAAKAYDLLGEMAEKGNPASISDVGVGLLAVRACVEGAGMNVKINLAGLKDEKFKSRLQSKLQKISAESEARFKQIIQLVEDKLSAG